jgi:hypothetical protein
VGASLARSWPLFEHRRRRRSHDSHDGRNYEAETILQGQFTNFVVQCEANVAVDLWQPIKAAIQIDAEEVANLFERLVVAEDHARKSDGFWAVWKETEGAVKTIVDWIDEARKDRRGIPKLGSRLLFDGVSWKETARDWEPAHGREAQIYGFFAVAGVVPIICKSFIRLIDGIGSFLLPDALLQLDRVIRKAVPGTLISDRGSLIHLARILTPLILGQTSLLRKNAELREAVLRILDVMVTQGSSGAYRLRDYLITPAVPSAH